MLTPARRGPVDNTSDCKSIRPRIEPHRQHLMSEYHFHSQITSSTIASGNPTSEMKDKRYNNSIKKYFGFWMNWSAFRVTLGPFVDELRGVHVVQRGTGNATIHSTVHVDAICSVPRSSLVENTWPPDGVIGEERIILLKWRKSACLGDVRPQKLAPILIKLLWH